MKTQVLSHVLQDEVEPVSVPFKDIMKVTWNIEVSTILKSNKRSSHNLNHAIEMKLRVENKTKSYEQIVLH